MMKSCNSNLFFVLFVTEYDLDQSEGIDNSGIDSSEWEEKIEQYLHDKFDKDKDDRNAPSLDNHLEAYDKLLIKGFEYIKEPKTSKKKTTKEPSTKNKEIKPKKNGYTYVRLGEIVCALDQDKQPTRYMETILFVEVKRKNEDVYRYLCLGYELTVDSTNAKNTEKSKRYTQSGPGVRMIDEIAFHVKLSIPDFFTLRENPEERPWIISHGPRYPYWLKAGKYTTEVSIKDERQAYYDRKYGGLTLEEIEIKQCEEVGEISVSDQEYVSEDEEDADENYEMIRGCV